MFSPRTKIDRRDLVRLLRVSLNNSHSHIRRWYRQHESIDKLNIQAHKNALSSTDEYVMDAFVIHDMVSFGSSSYFADRWKH